MRSRTAASGERAGAALLPASGHLVRTAPRATAHLGEIGDRLTIMSFARYTPEEAGLHAPRIAVLNEKNEVLRYEGGDSAPSLRIVGE